MHYAPKGRNHTHCRYPKLYIYKSAIHTTTVMVAPIDVVYWQLRGVHLQDYIKLLYLLLCCSPACAPSAALLLNDTLCAGMLASHLVMKREPLKTCMKQLCTQVGMIGVQYMYVHGFCQLPLSTLDLEGVQSTVWTHACCDFISDP